MSGSPEGGLQETQKKRLPVTSSLGTDMRRVSLTLCFIGQSCPNSRKGDITHISLREVYEGFAAIFIPLWVTSYRALQVMLRLSNKGFHLKNNEAPLKTFKK